VLCSALLFAALSVGFQVAQAMPSPQEGGSEDPAAEPTQEPAAAAQDEHRRQDPPSGQHEERDRNLLAFVLLDWGGLRSRLEQAGLQFDLLLTADVSWAATGGADPGGTALRSLIDLDLHFDTRPSLGIEGGTFYAALQVISGDDASSQFGVLQAFSNIDAEHRVQLARLWYEQRFGSTGTALRLGKIDANTKFAYVDGSAGFLHSSMGYSPTILGLPTYPDPAFGLALGQNLTAGLQLRLGVFDGAAQEGYSTGSLGPATLLGSPDDLFLIGELDLAWGSGRAGLGAWEHTGTFDRFDGGEENGTRGIYAVLDQRLSGEHGAQADSRGLDGFMQLGLADPDVSLFELHVGAGLSWLRPFSTRLEDELGLGISTVKLTQAAGAGVDEDFETAIELFYGFEPVPWVRLKPDLQYVIHPGGDSALDNALLLTLRLAASL